MIAARAILAGAALAMVVSSAGAASGAPQVPERAAIDVGSVRTGWLGSDAERIPCPVARADGITTLRAQVFALAWSEGGRCTIEARSLDFDACLLLESDDGTLIAHDEECGGGRQPRIVRALEAGRAFVVKVATSQPHEGSFELRVARDEPAAATREPARAGALADARARVARAESRDRPDPAVLAWALGLLGRELAEQGMVEEARAALQRALALVAARPGGGDDEQEPRLLLEFGRVHELAADPGAARDLYRRALERGEALLGRDHVRLAFPLERMAALCARQGEPEAGLAQAERALRLRETALGGDHPATTSSVQHLANLLRALGDDEAAEPLYERALAACERSVGSDDPATITAKRNLAGLLAAHHRRERAAALLASAFQACTRRFGPDGAETLATRGELAQLLVDQGRAAEALPHFEELLASARALHGAEDPRTAAALNNVAAVLKSLERPGDAEVLYRESVAILERTLGAGSPDTATGLHNLARLLHSSGRLEEARPLYERVLAIRVAAFGPDDPSLASTLSSLATLLRETGNLPRARELCERAVAIRRGTAAPDDPATAACLTELAVILKEQGELAQARPLCEEALAASEVAFGRNHPKTAAALSNLAAVLAAEGDFGQAAAVNREALAIWEAIRGAGSVPAAATMQNLAGVLHLQGEHAEALELCRRALAIELRELGELHRSTCASRANLAAMLLDAGRSREGWEVALAALDAVDAQVDRILWSLPEHERFLLAARQVSFLEIALSAASRLGDPDAEVAAYERVLDWKGKVSRSLRSSRAALDRALPREGQRRLVELRELQERISRAVFAESVADAAAHERELRELRERRAEVETALVRTLGPAAKPAERAQFGRLRQSLPEGTAFVDFWVHRRREAAARDQEPWSEPHLTAWISRADCERPVQVDLGLAEPLRAVVEDYLKHLVAFRGVRVVQPQVERPLDAAGRQLRERLWAPLAPHVGPAALVFISADGFLGTLPFEVIPADRERCLIEERAFVYLQDATALRTSAAAAAPAWQGDDLPMVAIGGVDYGRWESGAASPGGVARPLWVPLAETLGEAQAVLALRRSAFPRASPPTLLAAGDATEERLRDELSRCLVGHIATHGFFEPAGVPSLWAEIHDEGGTRFALRDEASKLTATLPGLLSGLVCAGANAAPAAGREDGYLTAEELTLLPLRGVRLVVLSACETGLGASQSGEGMLGIRAALRSAGVATVISSLWSIDDRATRQLMESFYRRLWIEGASTLEALRGAQLELIARNRTETPGDSRPATWGAFVLDGAWR